MARTLDVYLGRELVGVLIQDEHGNLEFRYGDAWLNHPDATPLSWSLPLRKAPFGRHECQEYFGGILPEGVNREIIAKNLGISAKNDFAMLEQIGGECAGAVAFIPSGQSLPDQNERYYHLTTTDLADLIKMLPRRPLMAGEDDVRLSLAGAQNKIPVYVEEAQIFLPLGGAPSTHILKPAMERIEGVVFNELLCMRLARAVGLPVAHAAQGIVEGIDYLLVERYDRIRKGDGSLLRLHQEDFCQALGIASEYKYQREGGPSLKQCFQLVRDASAAVPIDLIALLDAVNFNFLIGNNDAHGKNFSLLYKGENGAGIRLAPFYDLLCTVYYPDLSPKMAMKIGGEYLPEKVIARDYERFAKEAGLGRVAAKRRLLALAASIVKKLPEVALNHPVGIAVAGLIHGRCERIRQRFAG